MKIGKRTLLLGICFCLAVRTVFCAERRVTLNINPVWRFHLGEPKGEPFQPAFDDTQWGVVSLPHTHTLFPAEIKSFDVWNRTRSVGWYRREITVPDDWLKKRVFLEFLGAMQTTRLWVNGASVGEYAVSGYDSFHFDITPHIKAGKNLIAVRVDNTENENIPPDGRMTDYVRFGGLYRDVNLVMTDTLHLTFPWEGTNAGVRLTVMSGMGVSPMNSLSAVENPRAGRPCHLQAESTVRNESAEPRDCSLITEIRDRETRLIVAMTNQQQIAANSDFTFRQTSAPIPNPHLWSPDDPYLYRVNTIVVGLDRNPTEKRQGAGAVQIDTLGVRQSAGALPFSPEDSGAIELDRVQTKFGIRWFKFDTAKGFFLNGQPLKLVGANRHQTWPFIGNAVPKALHRRDAEQLKEMGCNWVRLSHYPHDPAYLDALDELGIMALGEGPTWMYSSGPTMMSNLEKSFRRMIRRDRNHPCIILWNACINHRPADPALVKAAEEEDPTRPHGPDSVPCPMAFRPKQIPGGGALAIEHTGHTFPISRGDRGSYGKPLQKWEGANETANREYDQAKRHWEQTNAAYLQTDNAGIAVWCQYDYNTFHNALNGIAPHGVFDLFRLPKYSFWWHQSELTQSPMAYIVRIDPTNACVFSNCEQVRLSQDTGAGYQPVAIRKPDRGYALHHPPFHFTVATNAVALKAEGLSAMSVGKFLCILLRKTR